MAFLIFDTGSGFCVKSGNGGGNGNDGECQKKHRCKVVWYDVASLPVKRQMLK